MDYMPRTRKLLKFMGFVPPNRAVTTYFLSQTIQQVMLIYFLLGGITYTIQTIEESKIQVLTKIETSLVLFILVTLYYGYLSLYYIKNDVEIVFDKINSMNEFGHLEKASRKHELIDYINVFMVGFCGFGGFLICTVTVFDMKNCKKYNLEHDTTILCGFTVGFKYPYDICCGFLYYFHWVFQFLVTILLTTKGTVFVGSGFSFYMAIISRCEDLCDQLRKFNTYDDFNDRRKCLHHCIYYHIRIIELADYINGCFSWVTFPCIVSHNIVIGVGCMGMMTGISVLSFLPTITWIGALFFACYLGEQVMQASTEIAVVAYELDWYKDTKLRRDILMMILRAQKPIRLKCGNFGELSMVTFKKIMQSAYAYATMQANNT
nr:odorant receptor 49b-like [Onthophagus taurus]